MITFLICLALLVAAYFVYGSYLERQASADDTNATPCKRMADGIDFIELPRWRVFLIQLLNIAGTGPIFGAILGACFGPVAFLWITIGGIFFGAMHDYLSGMMILRADGRSLPEVVGDYLGMPVRNFMRVFSIVMMVLVGTVFIVSPAQLLGTMVPGVSVSIWPWVIIVYYIVATLMPVDKIIGKLYPVFGVALVAMAVGLLGVLLSGQYAVPELTSFHNYQLDAEKLPIVPTLFITIACGAISGFHATQSPLMARCVGRERQCRSVFYGAMISESVIALIWAAIGMAFFGGATQLGEALAENGGNAAWAVDRIAHTTLGEVGSVLALLGVVVAPITSGDTAFRSARLIMADIFHMDQRPVMKRLYLCVPLFVVAYVLTQVNFDVLWRYFAWSNQTLAVFTLWAIFVWMVQRKRNYRIVLLPAMCMTFVITSFMFVSPQFFGFSDRGVAYMCAAVCTMSVAGYMMWKHVWRGDTRTVTDMD